MKIQIWLRFIRIDDDKLQQVDMASNSYLDIICDVR